MEINREYRSSVFAMLFNDRKELLTLYNAINGTAYTEEDRDIRAAVLRQLFLFTEKTRNYKICVTNWD